MCQPTQHFTLEIVMSVLLALSLPCHKLYAAIEYAVGTGLFSCKESRPEGSTSCQRFRGKFVITFTNWGVKMSHLCCRKLFVKKQLLCAP